MVKENTYQDMETRIREQLDIAKKLEDKEATISISTGFPERKVNLGKGCIGIRKSIALAKAKSSLSKLPENYSALLELKNLYLELK